MGFVLPGFTKNGTGEYTPKKTGFWPQFFGPLHIAVDISIDDVFQNNEMPGEENISIIQLLIKNGVDPFLQNIHGKNALDWSSEYKSNKVIEILTNEKT